MIYVVAGFPLARLADTRSRTVVLLVGLVMWTVMIFLTGFTVVFWQLLTLRIFLGIGEVRRGGWLLVWERPASSNYAIGTICSLLKTVETMHSPGNIICTASLYSVGMVEHSSCLV